MMMPHGAQRAGQRMNCDLLGRISLLLITRTFGQLSAQLVLLLEPINRGLCGPA